MRSLQIWCAFVTLMAAPSFAATIPVSATGMLTVGDVSAPFSIGPLEHSENSVQTLLVDDFQSRARLSYLHQLQSYHYILTGGGPLSGGGDTVKSEAAVEFTLAGDAFYSLSATRFDLAPEDMMAMEFSIDGGAWQAVSRDNGLAVHLASGIFGMGDHTLQWRIASWDPASTPAVHFTMAINTAPEPGTWLVGLAGVLIAAGRRLLV